MYTDPLPIGDFVRDSLEDPRAAKIIAEWRVDTVLIINIFVKDYRDMGIFFVDRANKSKIFDDMLYRLKKSKTIAELVKKAEKEEKDRKKSRHAEV